MIQLSRKEEWEDKRTKGRTLWLKSWTVGKGVKTEMSIHRMEEKWGTKDMSSTKEVREMEEKINRLEKVI